MIGNVGTAVVMFPILRRYSETLSLSYVASRIDRVDADRGRRDQSALGRHAARQPGLRRSGRTERRLTSWDRPSSRSTTGRSCSGPDSASVSTAAVGWMMYRTGLMPPRLAMLGVVGGPLIFASSIAGAVRGLPAGRPARPLRDPRGGLRTVICDLPDRQGVQTVAHPSPTRLERETAVTKHRSSCERGSPSMRSVRFAGTTSLLPCAIGSHPQDEKRYPYTAHASAQ